MRTAIRLVLVGALTAAFLVPATAASADPEPPCVNRICLVVVDDDADSDDDGYPDADEKALGSDPYDASSTPRPDVVIDLAIRGELWSFQEHATELVVFPQLTPGLDAFATALGTIPLPEKAWIDETPQRTLERLHGNGLTGVESVLAFAAPHREDAVPDVVGAWTGGMTLVAAGSPTVVASHGTYSYDTSKKGEEVGTGTVYRGHGSHHVAEGKGSAEGYSETTSFVDGELDEQTTITGTHNHGPELNSTTSVTVTTTSHDEFGNTVTTSTNVVVIVENEERTQEVTVTQTVNGGDAETIAHAKTTESCPNNACGQKYEDPDYVALTLTPADYARVAAKLDSIRTPGPDEGRLDGTLEVPDRDVYALYSGDGIVVLSSEPAIFNRAQPEYGPVLRDLAPHAGSRFPLDEGTTGRPGDDKP